MAKFMSSHTMPAGSVNRDQVQQIAQAAKNEPGIEPCRSFMNLAEGKVFCVMDASSKDALTNWFKKMNLPCDYLVAVELEGAEGEVKPV